MMQQRIVDLQETLMLEMPVSITGIGSQELVLGTEIQAGLVQQLRDHRGSAAMHADNANRVAGGMSARGRWLCDLRVGIRIHRAGRNF
jgi:hypothetical protein